MSNLTPTPRTDKNGVTSTRHMRPVGTPITARVMPAPQIAAVFDREQTLKWIEQKLEPSSNGVSAMRIVQYLADDDLLLLRSELECRDDVFENWTNRSLRIGKEHCGIAMVECYEFFVACHGGANFKLSEGMNAVYDTIGETPTHRPSEFNIGNIKATFLMKRLGMENSPDEYASDHEYYRECETLRSRLETLVPALPFLSMVASTQKRPFKNAAAVIDAAERFHSVEPEKFHPVFEFLSGRGGFFEADIVQELIENGTWALRDGLL